MSVASSPESKAVEKQAPEETELQKKQVQDFVNQLKALGIKMVVFDLDQTACKEHSGGVLRKKEDKFEDDMYLEKYLTEIAPDFKRVVPALVKANFYLSICTFTDTYYYFEESGDMRFPKKDFIAGEHLVNAFLNEHFDKETVDCFYNVPYNPSIHDEEVPRNKNYHMRKLVKHYNETKEIPLEMSECILFDDTADNINQARDFKAVLVDRTTAFQLPIAKLKTMKK